eukprot:CAMPEP_0197487052 /NCGR_PEP_ID=MMETSP1311-20131121/2057_1 /TAXON_ID=464262 /ORGANISM="Genus nov. species nov., Strain RCC856" /LENGTH=192 /DNA_ID=CAMNT_0043030515 /DNA_START=105 /DNA_END=683 /DNA_ORIENTATION=-
MTIQVFYWGACKKFWGRGLPIVLALEHSATKYDVKDRDELQGDFGFSFAVPIVKYEDGLSQSQLPSILDVLGEKVGLHGKDFAEKVAVKQLLLDFEDIMQENFAKPCKWTEENQRQDKWFSLLEKRLNANQFLASAEPTVADFHGFMAFELVTSKHGDIDAAKYPKLAAWWTAMNNLPAAKKVKESGVQVFP